MNILGELELAIDPIIEEAKVWAGKAATFLHDVAISLPMKAVALIKETSLGTAIFNLISAASLSNAPGATKFDAVFRAVENAYNAFVGNGGLTGLIHAGVNVLRQLIQSLYDDFSTTFLLKTPA